MKLENSLAISQMFNICASFREHAIRMQDKKYLMSDTTCNIFTRRYLKNFILIPILGPEADKSPSLCKFKGFSIRLDE